MFMVFIIIFKAADDSLSIKCNHGLIPQIFKSLVNSVKAHIISLSLLFLVSVVSMTLQSYTYMKKMYLFPLLYVVYKRQHRYELIFPYLVVLDSTVMKNTTFFLLSSRCVSGRFSLVDCIPYLLVRKYPIVMFLDFSIFFLISFSVRPGQVFSKGGNLLLLV